MKVKELKAALEKLGDFFDDCDVVIGETWKIASGVKSAGISELPPVSWDVSDLAFYITPTTELKKKDSPIERPRRTFEEIVASIESDTEHFFFNGAISKNNEDLAVFATDGWGYAQITKRGSFCGYCPAKYLPIISAACTEIAALRKEEA